MILHFGVIDLPYSYGTKGQTTGDVAEILEDKYGIMQAYYDAYEQEVVDAITKGFSDSLESLLSGAPARSDPFAGAMAKVEAGFKQALSNREFDGLTGVPTQAALDGVSHRRKHPYAKRASRPSFIDTGLYQSSFKAWID